MSDKKGIQKHCEYLESKIRKKQTKIDDLREQLQQKDEVIDEILKVEFFNNECPYSIIGDGWIQDLCDCDNCQDTYKECWLKYFKNRCKGDKNGN